jgi:hypothetical protein
LNKPRQPRDDFHELSVAEKKIKDNCIRDYAENPLFAIGKPLSQIEHRKVSPATRAAKTGAE